MLVANLLYCLQILRLDRFVERFLARGSEESRLLRGNRCGPRRLSLGSALARTASADALLVVDARDDASSSGDGSAAGGVD